VITFECPASAHGRIEIVPTRDGLHLVVSDDEHAISDVVVVIPLEDLVKYATLVQAASQSPPGFEDLILPIRKPR